MQIDYEEVKIQKIIFLKKLKPMCFDLFTEGNFFCK